MVTVLMAIGAVIGVLVIVLILMYIRGQIAAAKRAKKMRAVHDAMAAEHDAFFADVSARIKKGRRD